MSVIGEAVLAAAIEVLFEKLASSELLQFARHEKIYVHLKKWEKLLVKIQAVLDDAEEKQTTNWLVKIWLGELKNLVYDVEDILDEFATEALTRKLMFAPQPTTSKVRKLISNYCNSLNSKAIKFNVKMGSKLNETTARLQDIVTEKNNLDLIENLGGRSNRVYKRLPTTSLVNEACVYGREQDKETIVEHLLSDESTCDGVVSVVAIIGMGGVGKTTIAQLVYNDIRVVDHFELRAWACVPEDFDVVSVTKTILQSIATGTGDVNDLNLLQVKLMKKLFRKKFLLVLDDIWNENYEKWTVLCRPFEVGSPGSKIVVTTRNHGVSSMMGSLLAYPLKELSYDDCLHLFTQHSLGKRDFSGHQNLMEIGEKIVKKCKGLPLVAKTLGGLLRGKVNLSDWEDVLNSTIWDLPEERSDIIPALRLSYNYLSPHLKRCFAYCSIIPKDYEFRKEEIILLWMAEGFLPHESCKKSMEDLGCEYFHVLQSMSFFQQSINDMSRFMMHDLINDLAQWAAGELFFRMENMLGGDNQQNISKNLRHFSYFGGEYDGIKKFEAFYGVNDLCQLTYNGGLRNGINIFEAFSEVKHLRTFLPLMLPCLKLHCFLTRDVLNVLYKLRHLRVLSLHGYHIYELPNSIGDLKHLRYLDLSVIAIEYLPESISRLYNLQTLLLENCFFLKKICADIGNLIKLRHLNNSNSHSLIAMPLRVGNLTDLRTLINFVVGNNVGSGLGELKSLKHLQGTFGISRLENVHDVRDAKEADLNGKVGLKVLLLEWTSSIDNSRNTDMETQVLEMLRPTQKLEELTIKGFGGMKFPSWVGETSFSNLLFLRFENCRKCTSLPSVGQLPFLKNLVIKGMAGVKSVGTEFLGIDNSKPFPSLEYLSFEDLPEWKDWISHGTDQVEGFPKLRELCIVQCPELQGRLPGHLPSLERLVIKSCEQLLVSISNLPTICRVEIEGCNKAVWRSTANLGSLNLALLSDISNDKFPVEQFIQGLSKLEELGMVGCKDLTSFWQTGHGLLQDIRYLRRLVIKNCTQLLSLVAEEEEELHEHEFPCRLRYLELRDCECLVKLPQALQKLSSLQELSISNCLKLVSFPEVGLPSELRFIDIDKCNTLKSLPQAWMCSSNRSLERLSITHCASLTCIAKFLLPPNLKRLEIKGCNNLQTLVDEEHEESNNSGSLKYLVIQFCSSLKSLWSKSELPATLQHLELLFCPNLSSLSSRGNLPMALKCISINNCLKLESIAVRLHNNSSLESIRIYGCVNFKFLPQDLQKLSHLQDITISGCPNLVSFPERGLPSKNLTQLHIDECEKLKALPNCMHNLTSLEKLRIERCPSIMSFPEDGFATNLTSLMIGDVMICKPLFRWGLHKFTSLRRLHIEGCPEVVSFPQEEIRMMLPTSLTSLRIENFPNLERLSSISQILTCLEEVHLYSCPKLKSFPENGLPISLLRLYICACPLLKERCRKEKGEYWPMIAHIPYVMISD
ncbi:hypothetical protein ACOSP7_026645 [Xanthoceras sorbifolium]